MKKSIVTVVTLASLFFAGSFLITSCNSKKSDHMDGESQEHAEHKMDSTAMVYACPMHPEVTGKEGEKCSKCGMKLEAVKDAKKEDADNK